MATHPTIHIGSTGSEVKLAQEALQKRGYNPGPIDGLFGPQTRNAVLHYQNDRTTDPSPPALTMGPHPEAFNLPLHVDGIVGPHTWGRLDPPEIKKNSPQQAYVRLCQNILKSFGNPAFDPGPVDGIFGPHTEAAVKAFQTLFAPPSDGIVGPKTWLALHS
jgi:peptidoglycan hydrolase-like protein with peptidoglycan-binding domain